jgi:hypothetical protein
MPVPVAEARRIDAALDELGFEDTLLLPDGETAAPSDSLVHG